MRRDGVSRYLPVAYFVTALSMVAVLLPTALRPPPSQPPSSAELSPDAPPDDNQVLISELGRGSTATAGAGTGDVVPGEGPATLPAAQLRPRTGRCFGNPPRQVESLYAPPCAAAWTGKDNGGATYHGVTRTEVRIGILRGGNTAYEGPVDSAPEDQVDDVLRTYRVYERYFNRNFELYGRRVRFFVASTASGRSGNERNAVAKLDDEYGVFAIVGAATTGEPETLRRKIISFGGVNNDQTFYDRNAPYAYSFKIDGTKLVRLLAEFMCKQVWGRQSWFAGDPVLNGRKRKIGIIQYNDETHVLYGSQFQDDFKRMCGGVVDATQVYNYGDQGGNGLQVMTKFKAAEVTTVLWMGEYLGAVIGAAQGTQQGYFPEWIHAGGGGTDINSAAQLIEKAQWRNAIGITSIEMMMNRAYKDYYRAYKSVDPETEPEGSNDFPELLQLVGGVQNAGPVLTPVTLREGILRRWPSRPPDPRWTIGGGYGPGDYTYPDYIALEWWDPAAIDPETGRPGAYRHVYDGRRFTFGEIPSEAAPWFREGMHEPPGEAQR